MATEKENLPAVNINDTLAKINEKLSSLNKITETPYKTSGELGNGFGNLKNETKIQNLISLCSMINAKEAAYDAAAKELGLENKYPAFTVNGYTSEDCKSDIKLRIAVLSQQETFDKLNKAKERLSVFLTEEDKKRQALEDLKDILA